jgi:hypothetical protein
LLVTGGIDPTYLALTPQPSGPQGFINPLWLDNNGNLRSDKILLDTIDPNKTATLTGTELSIVDNTLGFGNEIFSTLTSTYLLVRNNQGIGGDPYYTSVSTAGIIIQANDGSHIQGSLSANNLTLANYDKSTIIDPYSFTVSDIASGEKSELRSTQLAITNSATSNIYTFGATGTQCQIDSSADNLVLNSGLLILNNIPTSNPGVIGAVWNDGGFLKIV